MRINQVMEKRNKPKPKDDVLRELQKAKSKLMYTNKEVYKNLEKMLVEMQKKSIQESNRYIRSQNS